MLLAAYSSKDIFGLCLATFYVIACMLVALKIMKLWPFDREVFTPRGELIKDTEDLMQQFIDNPSAESWGASWEFMVLHEIKTGEIEPVLFARWLKVSTQKPQLGGDPSTRTSDEEGEQCDPNINHHMSKRP